MKSHISATIDQDLIREVGRFSREERRTRSQIIEMALEEFLRARRGSEDEIVTSPGRFAGAFSRAETYER